MSCFLSVVNKSCSQQASCAQCQAPQNLPAQVGLFKLAFSVLQISRNPPHWIIGLLDKKLPNFASGKKRSEKFQNGCQTGNTSWSGEKLIFQKNIEKMHLFQKVSARLEPPPTIDTREKPSLTMAKWQSRNWGGKCGSVSLSDHH